MSRAIQRKIKYSFSYFGSLSSTLIRALLCLDIDSPTELAVLGYSYRISFLYSSPSRPDGHYYYYFYSTTPTPLKHLLNILQTLNDECGQFINAIGLSGLLLENCGIGANIPTPLDEPTDDVDYTEPPLPPSDYEDDYTGTAPEAAPTVTPLPISIASPTPTPTPSPDPPVIPSPVPYTPTVAGFPASCDSYFASLNSDDQLSCGLALAVSYLVHLKKKISSPYEPSTCSRIII